MNWRGAMTQSLALSLPWLNIESLKNDPIKLISLLQNRTSFRQEIGPLLTITLSNLRMNMDFSESAILLCVLRCMAMITEDWFHVTKKPFIDWTSLASQEEC